VSRQRSAILLILAAYFLVPLASCAGTSWSGTFEKALEADPQLTTSESTPSASPSPPIEPLPTTEAAELPADFPTEIPRYPGADLQEILPTPSAETTTSATITRWSSPDSRDRIFSFYRQQLQTNSWQIVEQPPANVSQGAIVAETTDLTVTVALPPIGSSLAASPTPTPAPTNSPSPPSTATEFTIRYQRSQNITEQPSSNLNWANFKLSETTNIGASGSTTAETGTIANTDTTEPVLPTSSNSFTDLNKAPKELQPYINDLAQLGVLTPSSSGTKENSSSTQFEPNQSITRREFARWLFNANNRLNRDRPAQQIRAGLETAQPAFRDVPASDRDYAVIQGLAEAGILPSPLSGNSTTVTFRPDQPLTRETLLLWKVPMDVRQSLPKASLESIQQTWGFQDAARIEPAAQRAVLADYQNGDQSNIRRAFGYTTLFQPKKVVSRAEAAAALWYFGYQGEGQSAQEALKAGGTTGG
jgi:hypothetical protein